MRHFLPADLNLAARTIHNTHGNYNFSVSSCKKVFAAQWNPGIQQVNFKEILCSHDISADATIATHNRTLHNNPE